MHIADLRIYSRPEYLCMIRKFLTEAAVMCEASEEWSHDLIIAVGEACQNVIRHAYKLDPNGEIIISLSQEGNCMVIEIRDFAPRVDVSKIKPRNLADIRPGGLGVHLMRELMDEVSYLAPPDGKGNLLRMRKCIG